MKEIVINELESTELKIADLVEMYKRNEQIFVVFKVSLSTYLKRLKKAGKSPNDTVEVYLAKAEDENIDDVLSEWL